MARSDLLISLVKASVSGDSKGAKVTSEAIIAEERAKKHNVLRIDFPGPCKPMATAMRPWNSLGALRRVTENFWSS